MKLSSLTLKKALDLLQKKQVSLDDIYQDIFRSIEYQNEKLNAYLCTDQNASLKAKERSSLPLMGLPISVKDNFLTKELPTTASSLVLKDYLPAYESTVTNKLIKNGAVLIGKTNMDAWAHGSSTETSQYGRTLNPQNTDFLPGGSSGGSAASIAANMTIASIGSETAGSIRQPASWCGVVGLKPTYGRVSRYGVVAMASSTDSPGPLTKTVEDGAILLNIIAGHDQNDGTSAKEKVIDYTTLLGQSVKGLRIGVMYLDLPGLGEAKIIYERELKIFEDNGAKVELVNALDPKYAISDYTIVQRSEVSSNLARYDGIRYGHDRSKFGDEAKRRLLLGTFTLSKGYADQYYNLAQKVRTLFRQDFDKLFESYDVLISPTTPWYADKVGSSENSAMYGELTDMLLEPSSLTGLPAISVPCYQDEQTRLFLGLNIMAPMFREDLVIKVADFYEKATKWNSWRNV